MIEHVKKFVIVFIIHFQNYVYLLKKNMTRTKNDNNIKKKTMSVSVLSLKSSIWIQVLLYRYRPSYIKQHPVSDTRVPSFAVVPVFFTMFKNLVIFLVLSDDRINLEIAARHPVAVLKNSFVGKLTHQMRENSKMSN